jgi:hypothetical protein
MGALAIYEFAQLRNAIDEEIARSPTLSAGVKRDLRKEASKLFKRHFSNHEGVRHFSAHAGSMVAKPAEMEKHTLRRGNSSLVAFNNMAGRKITSIFGGKEVSYELSQASVDALRAILEMRKAMLAEFLVRDPFS